MSSFLVEDKTINKIVTKLACDRNGEWLKDKMLKAGYDLNTYEGKRKLGWDMFALNIRAVNQRYDGDAESFRPLDYKFNLEPNYTKIHALKALKCWLYQSTEGDCDEKPLFKLMKEIESHWMDDIIRALLEYDTAKAWE